MRKKAEILGVSFDAIGREELTEKLNMLLESEEGGSLVTPNPEILMCADKDAEYRDVLNAAELCIADGVGVVLAAKMLKVPLKERIPGVEIGEEVLSICARDGIGVFFLGGKEGVAALAAENMQKKYEGLIVAGTHHGYFGEEENSRIVDIINRSGAKVLFVCIGFPKQEKWMHINRRYLTNIKLSLALGGSLDVYAGVVRRAPRFFCKVGLEWLWRCFASTAHFRRVTKLPIYLIRVMKEKSNAQIRS